MKKRAKGKPKIKLSLRFFFEQIGGAGCGVCAVNTILKKNNLKGAIFLFSMTRGTSPKRMLHELRKAGLIAVSKTIKIAKLKPWSILWYPRKGDDGGDHYVVVARILKDWVAIYDSAKKKPYWGSKSVLIRNWYKQFKKGKYGWVIEVKKPSGRS